MSIRKTLENTASDFVNNMAVPAAERMRVTADDLIDRIGSESRQIGERVGDKVSTRLDHLPEAALDRLNLVTVARARRRTVMGLLLGIVIGAVLMRVFSGEDGADRRRAIRVKLGWDDPQSAAAVTGDLPK